MKKRGRKKTKSKIELSIVVLSYNTKDLIIDCLESLKDVKNELSFEVIVVDNASSDGSQEAIEKFSKKNRFVKLIKSNDNLGFSAGNNLARKEAKGKYVLFLNSDTLMHKGTLKKSIEYLEKYKDVGAVTCKMILPNGTLDKDAKRAFPTPWVSLTHLVLKLDKLFPQSRLFAKYWYGYKSPEDTFEIDVAQGAFILTYKKILDNIGWFDEEYFLDGEDIDLCWRIKETGNKIVYMGNISIDHVKKASKSKPIREMRMKFATSGVISMEMFYRKHLWRNYPFFVNYPVVWGIRLLRYLRIIKVKIS